MILPKNDNSSINKLQNKHLKAFEKNLIRSIYIQLSQDKMISEITLNKLLKDYQFNQGDKND